METGKKAVIAGAGTMGASLAQVYANGGWDVTLYNRSVSGIERAKKLIAANQETMVSAGILTKEASEALLSRIVFTTDPETFRDAAFVSENIVENMDAKKAFWREVSEIVPEDAVLTTNTSGLSITEMAKAVKRPCRFCGQHWLNPPHILPLCEIIAGEETDPDLIPRMRQLALDLGKQPVACKDQPGFLVNRLQLALLREALHLIETGAATPEDIDTTLKAGLGLRYAAVGPLGTIDFGGIDTFAKVASYLFDDLANDPSPSHLLDQMVADGKLGVKAGAGFYDYSGDKADKAIRDRDQLYLDLAKVLYFNK